MALKSERLATNVTGSYYVDSSCVDCDLCRNTAPELFNRDDMVTGLSYVSRQPVTEADRLLAEEARVGCPIESIGNDGV
jgi:ferredoxin